jgi:ABC-type Na+ efflux pump permease subunit
MNMKRNILIAIIWFIFVYVMMVLFSSCSAERHLKIADKHIQKALSKGAKIDVDTAYRYIYKTDTIYDETINEVRFIETVLDSVPYLVTRRVYVPMSRQERLMYRDSLSHIRKLYELETKRVKVQEKEETKQVKAEQKTKKKTSPVSFLKNLMWILIFFAIIYFLIRLNRSL